MAIVTSIAARDVSCMLTRCLCPVMAGETGADNLRVVYAIHRGPAHVIVAVFAHIAGRHMRRALAFNTNSVMAAETVVCDTGMIKRCG